MTLRTPNRFKRAIARGEHQVGLWLTLESVIATEIAAHCGFDWLLLDMEHTANDLDAITRHLAVARGGTAEVVVRLPSLDPVLVKRLLDQGARSLMFPFVQTLADAQLAVASTRYPPHGIRGMGGSMRANRFGLLSDYMASHADEQCVIVQVESPQALAAIPDFCGVEGLDAIFVGPNDLSANMGLIGQSDHPEVKAAIAQALGAIKAGGRAAGMLDFTADGAKAQFAAGYDFVAVGSDMATLLSGLQRLRHTFKDGTEADAPRY